MSNGAYWRHLGKAAALALVLSAGVGHGDEGESVEAAAESSLAGIVFEASEVSANPVLAAPPPPRYSNISRKAG